LTTQNLKKKKRIYHLKDRRRIRLLNDSAIIKPLAAKAEGRQAEEIRALKQQMEFVLGATKTGLDIIDSEFNIRYIDPEWAKVYGDPKGKKCFEYFMDRSEVCPLCGIPTALKTKAVTVTEEILVKEDNRPIRVTTIPFQNEKGEWLVAEVNVDISERKCAEQALYKTYEDQEMRIQERTAQLARKNEAMELEISETKRVEDALRETERFLTSIFASIQDGISILDNDLNIIRVNPASEQWHSYAMPLVGKKCYEAYHRRSRRCEICPAHQTINTGKGAHEVVPKRGAEGEILGWFDLFTFPLVDTTTGKMKGVIEYVRDITERRQAEEALRNEKQRLQVLSDQAPFGMMMIDKEGIFKHVNPKFKELFGYDLADVPNGKTWFRKAYPDPTYRHRVISDWLKDLEKANPGEKRSRVLTATCKDGSEKIVNFISVRLETGENLVTCEDFTDQIRAEEALRKSEEESKKLAGENAIMAEIGRIISSTLKIEEVYERFAEEVRKLISFDRIAIRTINPKENTVTIAYILGVDIESRRIGDTTPLSGSVAEECIRTQSGFLFQPDSVDELVNGFPNLLPTIETGLRSMIFVPLISKDQVIGVLSLQATKPKAYAEKDLRLAERVGNQIAGAIANAQLFMQLKRTQEALRESERKFRDLYDYAPLGYHEYDKDGRITKVNQTDLEMLGYTAEEMIGQPIWKLNVGGEIVREQVLAKLAGTSPPGRNLERTYKRKDGTTFPVLIQDRLILDEMGQIKGIRCTIQDITEIKQAEEALQKSEERAKRIAQENVVMAEIGRIISSTLNIDDVYERFAEKVRSLIPFDRISINMINPEKNTATMTYVTGVEVVDRRRGDIVSVESNTITEECMRTRLGFLFQPESMDEVINKFQTLLSIFEAGLRSIMFVPLISKDEVIGILHLVSTKPKAYSGSDVRLAERIGSQIAGAIASAQLFTERKRAEEALRKSEEKFQKLFDEAPVGYMELDAKGCITQVNRTELTMLGYTSDEMLGQPLWRFVVEEEAAHEKIKAKLSGSTPFGKSFERTYRRKDGTTLPVMIEDALIRDVDGTITGIHATIRDVSEHKRVEKEMADLQEQLRQSQKIEAIGQLAGGIAHDFNNLLTVIKGYTQLSLLDLKETSPLWGNIQEIQKATQRATDLTRQLLAFSRRQILDPKVLDLNSLLRDTEKMLRRMIGEDIELITLLSEDLGRVKIDPGQIEQVILNLAVNARDAMPSGGKLTIETANVESDEDYAHAHVGVIPGRYVRLSVSDTGVGMSREVQQKAFDPFFTTKDKGKGTGLGLSTVYGIVTQSGGKIWVYSEPGHGTTFKIYFPTIEGELDALTGKSEMDSFPGGSETVLLVEDEPSVRDLANRLLRQQGYRVLEAANGKEALRLVQENGGEKIHLLLTDVVLPQMGGKELADQLKIFRPDLKVLYTSGYTDYAIVHHGVLDSGTHFLQKPFSLKTLSQKVREVLDG
jgi:PAS domain S-box-containing protein